MKEGDLVLVIGTCAKVAVNSNIGKTVTLMTSGYYEKGDVIGTNYPGINKVITKTGTHWYCKGDITVINRMFGWEKSVNEWWFHQDQLMPLFGNPDAVVIEEVKELEPNQ